MRKKTDGTSGKRAASYLERLNNSQGRRLPVDLNAEHNSKLNALLSAGYAKTAADVIRTAIDDAFARLQDAPEGGAAGVAGKQQAQQVT